MLFQLNKKTILIVSMNTKIANRSTEEGNSTNFQKIGAIRDKRSGALST